MGVKKLKVGVAGLGRMGQRHANNFLHRSPRSDLVAAFSPDPEEISWARVHLEPHGVTLYDSFDKMLEHPGLEAVVVATVTSVHAEQAIKAIEHNKHVLCEKPLSISPETSREVIAEARKKPHLKVMCGFSRRFDESYRDAYQKMDQGLIGRPTIFRSQTCDKLDPSGFFVAYAEKSGGAFVDMAIHDIDLTLWFFGDDATPKTISAAGVVAMQPALKNFNDVDNAVGFVEFWGGKIAYYLCSRMMAHGQEDVTEIIGTEGKISVNVNPQKNFVNFYSPAGITREVPPHYYGRFEAAFVTETIEFTECCLDNKPVPVKLASAAKAVQIGAWLQEAVRTGKQINFDETGKRIEPARL